MKTRKIFLPMAIVAAIFSTAFSSDGKNDKIEWFGFTEALEKGKAEKKIIVVDFYTDWCSWCKVMDEKTYGNKEIIKFAAEKVVMSKVNAETSEKGAYRGKEYTHRQLTQGFGITGFPATVFLNENGDFITKVPGYIPPEKFMPMLEYIDGEHYKTTPYDKFVEEREAKQAAPSGQ